MSIYLPGVTFPSQRVTPSDDGAVFAACVADGLYGGTITTSGTSLRLTVGKIVACGRVIRIASQTDIAMTQTSGPARLVLTIDKSKSAAQQVALDVQYGSDTLTSLTQQDINGSGTKYQVALCMASLSSSSTTILWTCGPAHGKGHGVQVTLPASWDSNNEQTAYVNGVTANTNVTCTYAYASKDAFQAADIDMVAQGEGWIKFHAVTVPSAAITANLLLL
jgi:hypothetical protein